MTEQLDQIAPVLSLDRCDEIYWGEPRGSAAESCQEVARAQRNDTLWRVYEALDRYDYASDFKTNLRRMLEEANVAGPAWLQPKPNRPDDLPF